MEVHFADGRVVAAGGLESARALAASGSSPVPAEIWHVSSNDVGVGTLIDRVELQPLARASTSPAQCGGMNGATSRRRREPCGPCASSAQVRVVQQPDHRARRQEAQRLGLPAAAAVADPGHRDQVGVALPSTSRPACGPRRWSRPRRGRCTRRPGRSRGARSKSTLMLQSRGTASGPPQWWVIAAPAAAGKCAPQRRSAAAPAPRSERSLLLADRALAARTAHRGRRSRCGRPWCAGRRRRGGGASPTSSPSRQPSSSRPTREAARWRSSASRAAGSAAARPRNWVV